MNAYLIVWQNSQKKHQFAVVLELSGQAAFQTLVEHMQQAEVEMPLPDTTTLATLGTIRGASPKVVLVGDSHS